MSTSPKNYEEAAEKLEDIVRKVENDEYGLEELGDRLKQALELVRFCKERLTATDEKIKTLLNEN